MDSVFENNILLTQTERLMMSGRPKQPKCTSIFETANVFFFCVNRDDRLSILQILMSSMVNKFKLFITVRAWYADLLHFLIHLFAVAHIC